MSWIPRRVPADSHENYRNLLEVSLLPLYSEMRPRVVVTGTATTCWQAKMGGNCP